jgi:hypothetical protein
MEALDIEFGMSQSNEGDVGEGDKQALSGRYSDVIVRS